MLDLRAFARAFLLPCPRQTREFMADLPSYFAAKPERAFDHGHKNALQFILDVRTFENTERPRDCFHRAQALVVGLGA